MPLTAAFDAMNRIKWNIEELDVLKTISDSDKKKVLTEYKKGYHFLIFYGKFVAVFGFVFFSMHIEPWIESFSLWARFLVMGIISCLIYKFCTFIEINIVGKKAIKDLIRDLGTK